MNKPVRTAKQEALSAVSALPDDASFDDIFYQLLLLQRIREGIDEIEADRNVSPEEAAAQLANFRALILEGLESGPGVEADEAFFEELRAEIRTRAAE
ncbi:MAG: hypothetical protein U1E40_14610 [Amaricoccus sp.]